MKIIVMAASAGGIEALRSVLGGLPEALPAPVIVVLHMSPSAGRSLPTILDKAGPLPAAVAVDGEQLAPGRVYVCVPDHHILVAGSHLHVLRGPKENGHRPAADPLFRSAARHYDGHAVGVVLSGTLSDGTDGLRAIRRAGGIAVVQDPSDAIFDGMPSSALNFCGADHVAPAADIGPLLGRLAVEEGAMSPSESINRQPRAAHSADAPDLSAGASRTSPAQWPCPDCGGVLWHADDGEGGADLSFECRVGHRWAFDSLFERQGAEVEAALWMALRTLEDRLALCRHLAESARRAGRTASARRYLSDTEDLARSASLLRSLLVGVAAELPKAGEHG